MPKLNCEDIVADIKRRMANSQTVTEDDLRRLTGADYPQVILPLDVLTKLLEQGAALKEENERLKSRQKPVAWVWVSDGNQFADNFPAYSFNEIESLPAGKHNLYLSPPAEAEEISLLKARVAELEKDIKRVIETYDSAITAKGIENHAKALCAFIDSVKALKEPANEG